MLDVTILKNPIVLGIFTASITFLYLWWEEKKRREKNPKTRERSVNVITPLVVGIITWFITSSYFNYQSTDSNINNINNSGPPPTLLGGKKSGYIVTSKGSINSEHSLGSANYHIIGKDNVRMPPTDVFIDLAKF